VARPPRVVAVHGNVFVIGSCSDRERPLERSRIAVDRPGIRPRARAKPPGTWPIRVARCKTKRFRSLGDRGRGGSSGVGPRRNVGERRRFGSDRSSHFGAFPTRFFPDRVAAIAPHLGNPRNEVVLKAAAIRFDPVRLGSGKTEPLPDRVDFPPAGAIRSAAR
jgi:hypothetical protein